MTVKDYYNAVNDFAPFNFADSWDNVGLIVGGMELSAKKVMLALDITQKAINEAVDNKVELIITHHPLMFSAIKRITSDSMEYQLAKNGISLISAHTNLDITEGGVNDVLCNKIGLVNVSGIAKSGSSKYYNFAVYIPEENAEALYHAFVENGIGNIENYNGCGFMSSGKGKFTPMEGSNPTIGEIKTPQEVQEIKLEFPLVHSNDIAKAISTVLKHHPYETPTYTITENYIKTCDNYIGRIGELPEPLSPKDFAMQIKLGLNAPGVQFTDLGKKIKTVAVCSGGGGGVVADAKQLNADAFVTGEIKHDLVLSSNNAGMATFQAGHFITETIVMETLKSELEKRIEYADILLSQTVTDEIKFI